MLCLHTACLERLVKMFQFVRKTCHTTLRYVLVSRAIYKQSTINGYCARAPRRGVAQIPYNASLDGGLYAVSELYCF